MVIKSAIQQWREQAPWTDVANIEQDLIISRALVAIFILPFQLNRSILSIGLMASRAMLSSTSTAGHSCLRVL